MITIFTKSGTLKGNSAVAIILKSQKHKWTKSVKVASMLPDNSFSKSIVLDAIAILHSLKHIKSKYKKKKVIVYNDSIHIMSALKKEEDKFVNKTKLNAIEALRDTVGTFNNLEIKQFPKKCEYVEELNHLFIECALDKIEIDEKD
jgi:hypothetical protein